jgi:hypothetical protein
MTTDKKFLADLENLSEFLWLHDRYVHWKQPLQGIDLQAVTVNNIS